MVTALLMEDPKTGKKYKVKIVTRPILNVKIDAFSIITHQCDERWVEDTILATAKQVGSEVDYHIDIRKGAIEKKHFMHEHSTNPELNPQFYEEEE